MGFFEKLECIIRINCETGPLDFNKYWDGASFNFSLFFDDLSRTRKGKAKEAAKQLSSLYAEI